MQTKNGRVYTIYTCMHILQQNQRGEKSILISLIIILAKIHIHQSASFNQNPLF